MKEDSERDGGGKDAAHLGEAEQREGGRAHEQARDDRGRCGGRRLPRGSAARGRAGDGQEERVVGHGDGEEADGGPQVRGDERLRQQGGAERGHGGGGGGRCAGALVDAQRCGVGEHDEQRARDGRHGPRRGEHRFEVVPHLEAERASKGGSDSIGRNGLAETWKSYSAKQAEAGRDSTPKLGQDAVF